MTADVMEADLRSALPSPSRTRQRRRLKESQFALLLMLPAGAVLVVILGSPLFELVKNSLYSGGLLTGGRHFVGFSNYTSALTSGDVQSSAGRTALYALMVVPTEFVIGFAMALLFRRWAIVRVS